MMVRVSMEHSTSPAAFLLSTHQEQRISKASNSPCSAPWKPSPEWPSCCPLLPRDKTRLTKVYPAVYFMSILQPRSAYTYLLSHSKLGDPSRVSWLPLYPCNALYGAWYTTGERLNKRRPTEPASGRQGSSRQVTVLCFVLEIQVICQITMRPII